MKLKEAMKQATLGPLKAENHAHNSRGNVFIFGSDVTIDVKCGGFDKIASLATAAVLAHGHKLLEAGIVEALRQCHDAMTQCGGCVPMDGAIDIDALLALAEEVEIK